MSVSAQVCPACGSTKVESSSPSAYRYRGAGLGPITLHGGVQQVNCGACGAKSIHIEREQQLLQVLALMLLVKPGHLTGREMRYLRSACDLSQAKLALSLGVRRETVAERESRDTPGLDAGAEFFLRVILLRRFLEYLESDDHLGAEHHKVLRDHCNAVFSMSDRVLKHPRKRTLAVRQVNKVWEPELAIA